MTLYFTSRQTGELLKFTSIDNSIFHSYELSRDGIHSFFKCQLVYTLHGSVFAHENSCFIALDYTTCDPIHAPDSFNYMYRLLKAGDIDAVNAVRSQGHYLWNNKFNIYYDCINNVWKDFNFNNLITHILTTDGFEVPLYHNIGFKHEIGRLI